MKKLFCVLCLWSGICMEASAKPPVREGYRFGVSAGLGLGVMTHTHLGLHYTSPNGAMFSILWLNQFRPSPEMPSDYHGGGFTNNKAYQEIQSIGLCAGKSFTGSDGLVKYNLQAGLLYGESARPHSFEPYQSSGGGIFGGLSKNYTYRTERKELLCFAIYPTVDILFSRYAGLRLGALANLNAVQSTLAFEMGLVLGVLRKKRIR